MMSKMIDTNALLRTVGASSVEELEGVLDNSSPSLVEYSIRSLIECSDDEYFNLANTESKLSIGSIDIIFDYNKNCHIIDNYSSKDDEGQLYL